MLRLKLLFNDAAANVLVSVTSFVSSTMDGLALNVQVWFL